MSGTAKRVRYGKREIQQGFADLLDDTRSNDWQSTCQELPLATRIDCDLAIISLRPIILLEKIACRNRKNTRGVMVRSLHDTRADSFCTMTLRRTRRPCYDPNAKQSSIDLSAWLAFLHGHLDIHSAFSNSPPFANDKEMSPNQEG